MAPTARLRRDLSTTVMSSRERRCSCLWCRQKPLLEAVKVKTPMTATKLMMRSATVAGKCSFANGARPLRRDGERAGARKKKRDAQPGPQKQQTPVPREPGREKTLV